MLFPQALPQRMDDPEGKDFAAAVWLTISPNLAGRPVTGAVKSSLVELARDNKVPMAFYFGKSDTSGATLAKNYLDAIGSGKKLELKNTGSKAIPTELTGSKLLSGRLGTVDFIVDYLNRVMEDRGSKEWKKRDEEKSRYFWTVNGRPKLPAAKNIGETVVGPIPGAMIKLGSP
jgi:hypothetical protein